MIGVPRYGQFPQNRHLPYDQPECPVHVTRKRFNSLNPELRLSAEFFQSGIPSNHLESKTDAGFTSSASRVGSVIVSVKPGLLRKKTYVNGRIQGRILGRIAAYWVLYHVVLWHGLFVYRFAQYRAAITTGGEVVPFRDLYGQFCADFYPLIICALFILPAFLLDFVRLTHRIAGPLIRFRTAMQDVMAGKRVEEVTLRQRDLLTDFQTEFNEFLKYYNARLDVAEGDSAPQESPEPAQMSNDDADLVQGVLSPDQNVSEPATSPAEAAVAVNS